VIRLGPQTGEHDARRDESECNRSRSDPTGTRLADALAKEHQEQESGKWQCRDQPDKSDHVR
jgi:hypothetical protein